MLDALRNNNYDYEILYLINVYTLGQTLAGLVVWATTYPRTSGSTLLRSWAHMSSDPQESPTTGKPRLTPKDSAMPGFYATGSRLAQRAVPLY
ncbi:hypothetical protein EB796_009042 [Bugula neritina]|uniref:Uncharacterized protein n=1 Tax=Bugula neritina TaxID=10212 RepID=A0A7J7K4W4_BUGNE|nr:hypothetical protein EB796_009042 [Bugula neritina]